MDFNVVGVGEVLWDLLPAGRQMGGAPANFASHAHALGAAAQVVSRVGNDPLGREILDRLRGLGLGTNGVTSDPSAPTGTVSVVLAAQGHPTFTIHERVAWDYLEVGEDMLHTAARAAVICFGTLGQRHPVARAAVRTVLQAAPPTALRVFDINLRQHFYSGALIEESLAVADVLKLNESELPRLAELFQLAGDERSQLTELARRFRLRAVAYTRGDRGSLLHSQGHWSEHPGIPVTVVDTVGAGDAFTAALALGLLAGWSLDSVNQHASEVAAYVCSQHGATPILPERWRAPFLANRSGRPEVQNETSWPSLV